MSKYRAAWIAPVLAISLIHAARAQSDYAFTLIADTRDPQYSGWSWHSTPSISNSGIVAWSGQVAVGGQSIRSSVFMGNGASTVTIADFQQLTRNAFLNASINNSDQVAYSVNNGGVSSIALYNGQGTTPFLMPGAPWAGTWGGGLSDVTTIVQNRQTGGGLVTVRQGGQVAQQAPLNGLSSGQFPSMSRNGQYAALFATRTSDDAPIIYTLDGHRFVINASASVGIHSVEVNNHGLVSYIVNDAGTANDRLEVLNARTGATRTLVSSTELPTTLLGGAGTSSMNNFNEVVFLGAQALYKTSTSGGSPQTVLRQGDVVLSDGSVLQTVVSFSGYGGHAYNDRGQFVFLATLRLNGHDFSAILRADPIAGVSPGNPILPDNPIPIPSVGWTFNPTSFVRPRVIRYYDPEVAIGYDFATSAGARFSTVHIPAPLGNGDDVFELQVNGLTFPLNAGDVFDFTAIFSEGVTSFRVAGIDASEAVNPSDPEAFVTGLAFMDDGSTNFSFTMMPITEAVPEPQSIIIMALGLAVIALRRKTDGRRVATPQYDPVATWLLRRLNARVLRIAGSLAAKAGIGRTRDHGSRCGRGPSFNCWVQR